MAFDTNVNCKLNESDGKWAVHLRMSTDRLDVDKLVGGILTICRLSHGEILALSQQTRSPWCAQSRRCLIRARVHISPDPGIYAGPVAQNYAAAGIYSDGVGAIMRKILDYHLIIAVPTFVGRIVVLDYRARSR